MDYNKLTKEELIKLLQEKDNNKSIKKEFHYTDIKSFEDACDKLNISTDIEINIPQKDLEGYMIALYKLTTIFKAINDGWQPDWNNSNESKYYPYFRMSSVSFDDSIFNGWYSFSVAGSRLCTYSREVSDYIGKQFEDLYKEAFLIK